MRQTGEIFERMDELMKEKGILEKDLISFLGLAQGTFSQWRRGNGDSYYRYIKEICQYLHISPNELVLGANDDTKHDDIALSKDELSIISKYRAMDLRTRKQLSIIIDALTIAL